jgi:hypothetical protein
MGRIKQGDPEVFDDFQFLLVSPQILTYPRFLVYQDPGILPYARQKGGESTLRGSPCGCILVSETGPQTELSAKTPLIWTKMVVGELLNQDDLV